jgi:hypothetical protein
LLVACGVWFGYTIKLFACYHTISTAQDKYENAKILTMFSRHTVLYIEDKVVLIPTSEIKKIESQPLTLSNATTSATKEDGQVKQR